MNIHADVSALERGTHTVQAELELDDAFEIVSYPEITVSVNERTAEELEELEELKNSPDETEETER